eukprot:TRINITY_DN24010_c0_g1_i1.p1 TRINITY_DN24010_c0_g1~~TRINITY_DN24010_c0_g1_i1.p1  ORF type:complete len:653 (+),score=167.73 TRINITY_DN24010_c0_g1_i1:31-1959(+)
MTSEWKKVSEQAGTLVAGQVAIPPLSSVLDPKVPAVELESDRLHAAMAWLYSAVQGLQQQSSSMAAELRRLDGTMQAYGDLAAAEAATRSVEAASPPDVSRSLEDVRTLIKQHEQRRIGEQKALEMRLDSVTSSVERRLKASDLLDIQNQLMGKLTEITNTSQEELNLLTKALRGESVNERRQFQIAFDSLRSKVEAQLELLATPPGGSEQRLRTAVAAAEAAATTASKAANEVLGLGGATAGGRKPSTPGLSSDLEARLRVLEEAAGIAELAHSSSGGGGAGGAAFETGQCLEGSPSHGSRPISRKSNSDLQARLERVESTLAALRSAGFGRGVLAAGSSEGKPASEEGLLDLGGDMAPHMVDLYKQQTDTHHQFLELQSRLSNLEESLASGGIPGGRPLSPDDLGKSWEEPLKELLSRNTSLGEELQDHAGKVSKLGRAVDAVATYIGSTGGSRRNRNPGDDPLDWLEQRVHEWMKSREGVTIEARLHSLEGSEKRLASLEQVLGKLDVHEMQEIPPQLIIIRQDQEVFKKDLHQELQELKVIVGCIEACVPKETRKAIALFKRAAGASDELIVTPRTFKVESEILGLREDMETRLKAAEHHVSEQCDNMFIAVRGLEKKQDRLESQVQDVSAAPQKMLS